MPTLQYNGSITQNVFSSESISGNNWRSLDFFNAVIKWPSDVNPSLVGLTLSDLLKNPLFNFSYSIGITLTGSQYYDDSSYPTIDLALVVSGGNKFDRSYTADAPGSVGTGKYNVNDSFSISNYP